MIDHFDGEYHFLSNFFPWEITHDNLVFRTVEHAYQAAKTHDSELREGICQLRSPAAAKKIGQLIPCRQDWEDVKVSVMRELLERKFVGIMTERLLNTGHDVLVEGNYWHDNFWGICKCASCPGEGQNMLGELLMEHREKLWRSVRPT